MLARKESLYLDLRIWGSGVRISSGAPPSTHLRTLDGACAAGQNGPFEYVFAAFDADLGIVYLNYVDKRLQVGFPEWH
jgi:hypothetical protein